MFISHIPVDNIHRFQLVDNIHKYSMISYSRNRFIYNSLNQIAECYGLINVCFFMFQFFFFFDLRFLHNLKTIFNQNPKKKWLKRLTSSIAGSTRFELSCSEEGILKATALGSAHFFTRPC